MAADLRRTALVTGASTGLGYVIAVALADRGYNLAVADLDTNMLEKLLNDPAVQDREVVPIRLDLRSEQDVVQAVAAAVEAFGTLDVLVNNAGRTLIKPALDVSWAEWDDVIN